MTESDLQSEIEKIFVERDALKAENAQLLAAASKPVKPLRPDHLCNKVYAATGAHPGTPGNVTVGVVAHCQCGNSWPDDISACAPKPSKPVLGEPLSGEQWSALSRTNASILWWNCFRETWNVDKIADLSPPGEHDYPGNIYYFLSDNFPLPTLPEPADVPAVPQESELSKWFDRVTQATAEPWPSAFHDVNLDTARSELLAALGGSHE